MNWPIQLCRVFTCAVVLFLATAGVWAQKPTVASRVVDTVDDTRTVTLKGNVHPLARAANDQGSVADSQPMTRMMLLLQRSPEQELALHQLLDAQQTKSSGTYHAWLSPDQFGKQFGPSDSDLQAVTDWLTRQGFQLANVSKGRTVIEFNGTAGQVRNAFHTEIHKFAVNGESHFANISDPAIPQALSPVVAGVVALHNFSKHPFIRKNGLYRRAKGSNQLQPLFTFGSPANYAIGPGDFAKIYSIPSGANGSGKTIAIIAQTNINIQDVTDFRTMFGLPPYSTSCTPGPCLNVVVNGVDPGIQSSDEIEADLDTQWAGAVAPNANIVLVVSESTQANPGQISGGVDLSALYAVDNNLGDTISDSYGACELNLGTSGNAFYRSVWEQAAAQGITVSVAAGDSGPAGCDPNFGLNGDPNAAVGGVAVSGLASTPFNVAVGGTDFDPSTIPTGTTSNQYWNAASDTVTSALGYIPETTWDDSACAFAFSSTNTTCASIDTTNGTDISAGGGGPSNCTNAPTNCLGGYSKPSFQSGITPADSARDIPDISFFSSNGGVPNVGAGVAYVVCESDANPNGNSCFNPPFQNFSLVGGTSAATPAFAAVMALVDQSTGSRQGNANYVLYALAASDSNYTGSNCTSSLGQTPAGGCVFNDVTKGNNSVACDAGTPDCSDNSQGSSTYGVVICDASTNYPCPASSNGFPAFLATAKYDLATGLGSINVGNLLAKWTSATRGSSMTTLSNPTGGSPSGTAFTATVTVSPATAAGDASLIALASDKTTVLGTFGPFTVTAGAAAITTNLLPVGTAYVEASYGGNATLAVSTSNPVALSSAVTGASYTAKTTVNFVGYNSSGVPNPPTTSSQNFPYGTPYILQIVVTKSDGTNCAFGYPATKPSTIPCPTGTITLMDGTTPLTDFLNNGTPTNVTKLNSLGIAEDQPINLSATVNGSTPGVHNITATYSGDSNYSAGSVSNTLKITIQQVATTTQLSSSLSSITSGATVTLTAAILPSTSSNGLAPCGGSSTGTVQFTNNGSALPGTVTYTAVPINSTTGTVSCTATLSTAISSLYPPPTVKPGTPEIPRIPLVLAVLSLLLFALGLRWIPQTRRPAYTFAGLLLVALLIGVVAGCGGGGGGGGGGGNSRTIGATYSGDANYTKSTAAPIVITIQ